MIRILLDTNALVYFFDKKTDINSLLDKSLNVPFELLYADVSINELKTIKRNDVVRWLYGLGLKKTDSLQKSGPVDDMLIEISRANELYLLTFDKILAQNALANGIGIIRISGQSARIEQ